MRTSNFGDWVTDWVTRRNLEMHPHLRREVHICILLPGPGPWSKSEVKWGLRCMVVNGVGGRLFLNRVMERRGEERLQSVLQPHLSIIHRVRWGLRSTEYEYTDAIIVSYDLSDSQSEFQNHGNHFLLSKEEKFILEGGKTDEKPTDVVVEIHSG